MPQLLSSSILLITLFIYTVVQCVDGFVGCQHHRSASSMQMAVEDATLLTRSEAIMYPLGFLAAFRTGAAISVINQPQIPPVDVAVGSTVLRLPNNYGTRVRLFYPTTTAANNNDAAVTMAPYCTDGRKTSDGMARLVKFDALGLSFLLAHLANASSGCVEDGPIDLSRSDDDELPLLVYSHGYGGNMDMATYFFRTMACKGMIIAAVEHTDGTASSTVLKDGEERKFNEYLMTGRQQLTRRASEILEAVDFLPKELERMYPAINIGSVMVGGTSYGAPSAIMAANGASTNANISGVILHDPALGMGYGMLPPNGAKSKIPTVTYTSDEYNKANVRYGDLTMHVRGAYHGNFVDAPLWAPSIIMRFLSILIPAAGPANPVEVHEQLAESAAAFIRNKNPASPYVMAGSLFEFVE